MSTEETVPTQPESLSVQLTRMEGTLGLVLFQITQVTARQDKTEAKLERHAEMFVTHSSHIQRLTEQAVARDATAIALATALKDAEETRRTKTEEKWSPFQKIVTGLGGVAIVIGLVVPVINALNSVPQ